jgi:hypothetical protein
MPERYKAGLDQSGNMRLSEGQGMHIANPGTTRGQMEEWVERATEGRWKDTYRAAINLFDNPPTPILAGPLTVEQLDNLSPGSTIYSASTGAVFWRRPMAHKWEGSAGGYSFTEDLDRDHGTIYQVTRPTGAHQ